MVEWSLTSPMVLTMEFMPGTKISDVDTLRAAGIDTTLTAGRATEAYLTQILYAPSAIGPPALCPSQHSTAVSPNVRMLRQHGRVQLPGTRHALGTGGGVRRGCSQWRRWWQKCALLLYPPATTGSVQCARWDTVACCAPSHRALCNAGTPHTCHVALMLRVRVKHRQGRRGGPAPAEGCHSVPTVCACCSKHGFFHADPHPGNIAIDRAGNLVFYDFGMMGEIKADVRENLLEVFYGVYEKDADRVLDALITLGVLRLKAGDRVSLRRCAATNRPCLDHSPVHPYLAPCIPRVLLQYCSLSPVVDWVGRPLCCGQYARLLVQRITAVDDDRCAWLRRGLTLAWQVLQPVPACGMHGGCCAGPSAS